MSDHMDGRARRYAHRRPEVLKAAAEHALEHGLASLSLRQVAQTVGVSHATLVHHFGSKEQLVSEITDVALARVMTVPDLDPDDPDPLTTVWKRGTSPDGLRYLRLFAEISAVAMRDNPGVKAAVARSVTERQQLIAAGLVMRGDSPEHAETVSSALMGLMRGLSADLLVTGDRDRVDAAFRLGMAALLATSAASAPSET
jgi:AcrR family transcriptional regulator